MTSRSRRRSGLTLLSLLATQFVLAPFSACAQEHEGHDGPSHASVVDGHAPESRVMIEPHDDRVVDPASSPEPTPVDCLALAACGAPAIGQVGATAQVRIADSVGHDPWQLLDEPAAIDLSLSTPPPKI